MGSVSRDLRSAWRFWRRRGAVAAVLVLTLGLALGLTVAISSVVDAVLLRPLPYPEPGRLVLLWETHPEQDDGWRLASPLSLERWRRLDGIFEAVAASRAWRPLLLDGAEAEPLSGAAVSRGFFALLGGRPALGRGFTAADHRADAAPVVVIGHRAWRRLFGGDPTLVGGTVRLGSGARSFEATVVGVLPEGFELEAPLGFGRAEIFRPLAEGSPEARSPQRSLRVFGRLAEGVGLEAAGERLGAVARSLAAEAPASHGAWGAAVARAHEQLVAPVLPALLTLQAGVVFLFLITCVNSGVLLLAQGIERRREVAVHLALGARRRHLLRRRLAESLLLGLASGGLGWLLAHWLLGFFLSGVGLARLPRVGSVALDLRMLLATAALVAATAGVFALWPALRDGRVAPAALLAGSARGALGGAASDRRQQRFLVAVEIALALVLTVVSTLAALGFARLSAVDPGFDAERALAWRLELPRVLYPDTPDADALLESLLRGVESLESVAAAGWVNEMPMGGASMMTRAVAEGTAGEAGAAPGDAREARAEFYGVSPGYFRAMGIALLAGEPPEARPRGAVPWAVVSAGAARRLWPGEEAVGQRLTLDWGTGRPHEVVAVVGDVHRHGLAHAAPAIVYLPYGEVPHRALTLVVRPTTEAWARGREALASELRDRLESLGGPLFRGELVGVGQRVEHDLAEPRTRALALGVFGGLSLLIAAMGSYSVVAYALARRRRELALRLAVGARPRDLVRQLVGDALAMIWPGLAAGLLAAPAAGRLAASAFYGVSGAGLPLLAGAALLLTAVALGAAAAAARRALRIEPRSALGAP